VIYHLIVFGLTKIKNTNTLYDEKAFWSANKLCTSNTVNRSSTVHAWLLRIALLSFVLSFIKVRLSSYVTQFMLCDPKILTFTGSW